MGQAAELLTSTVAQSDSPPEQPTGVPPSDETEASADGATDAATTPDGAAAKTQTDSVSKQHAALTRRLNAANAIETRAAAKLREAEQRELALQERERWLASASEDEVLNEIAKARGIDTSTFVKRGIQRIATGQLTPEQKAEAEREEARKQREQDRKDLEELKAHRAEQQRQAVIDDWITGDILPTAKAGAEARPYLSDLSDNELAEKALAVATAYSRRTGGLVPDTEDLLNHLEEQEAAAVKAAAERLNKRAKKAQADKPGAVAGNRNPETPAPSRTLSNRNASETPSNGKRELSEQERIEWAAEVLRNQTA